MELSQPISAPRFLFRLLLPAEWLLLGGFAFWCLLLAIGYPLLLPADEGGEVLKMISNATHYALILSSSIVFYVGAFAIRYVLHGQKSWRIFLRDITLFSRLLFCFVAAVYLMLCFKWWSHLGMPLYDDVYWRIDLMFDGLKRVLVGFQNIVQTDSVLYMQVFTVNFYLAYLLSIAIDMRVFCRVVTAGIGVALLGGIGYMIAPAYGPFIFSDHIGTGLSRVNALQHIMLEGTKVFRESGGTVFDRYKFEVALGAMPSLHVAHTVVTSVYAYRLHKGLGVLFTMVALWIAAYASITQFHYLIDLPAGALVAGLSIWLTEYLYKKRNHIETVCKAAPARVYVNPT